MISPRIPPANSIDPSMIEGTPIRYAAVGGIPAKARSCPSKANRRFPPPWSVEQIPGGYKVKDANGQSLAYVYDVRPELTPT